MIVGTAGHVDHGKSTLVQALTGVDPDRLAEEKRRGMTIELGYAYAGPLGFVDVPGHERFVGTMLSGAGGIDAALLVVAADEGVKPQTIEHARILDLLGIDRGVVALTRIDRARGQVEQAAAGVRALLRGSGLATAEVFPVCAPGGEGLEALRKALLALGGRPRDDWRLPRLAVDRVFILAGAGLVVAGTLVAGRIAVGDRLVVSPAGVEARVRGLHAQNRRAEAAEAGQRVALNLVGVARDQVGRGDWVLHPALHAPTQLFDATLRLLPDETLPRQGAPVHLHLAAAHVTARLYPLADGLVRLVPERPVGALAGDRFVLRDAGGARTIGGGLVLDPAPPRRQARRPERLAAVAAQQGDDAAALAAVLEQNWVDAAAFARARNLPPERWRSLLEAAGGVQAAGLALRAAELGSLRRALVAAVAAHHAAQPDEPGLQPQRARAALTPRPPPGLFAALLEATLRRGELEQDGPWLRLPGHAAKLAPEDERLWTAVRARIADQRFRPPRTRDLALALGMAEPAMRRKLKRFGRLGRVVEVAHDHFFLRQTVVEMVGIAAALAQEEGVVTAASLRDRLGNGRKVAIQVLEFFDSAGVTRRSGDERVMVPDRLGSFGAPAAAGSGQERRSAGG